jgi:urease accessory protein
MEGTARPRAPAPVPTETAGRHCEGAKRRSNPDRGSGSLRLDCFAAARNDGWVVSRETGGSWVLHLGEVMLHAHSVRPAGSWSEEPADAVVLDYDDRHRRRVAMTGVRGLAFLLDLPEAVMLRGGDGLALDDGRIVEVVAAPEELAEIRAADPAALARLAWHLGNRHLPTELLKKSLRIRRDHVIEDMARRLGAEVTAIEAPFNPEGGAYVAAAAAHDHDHAHHGDAHHRHGDHQSVGAPPHAHSHDHHDHGHPHDHDHSSEPHGRAGR